MSPAKLRNLTKSTREKLVQVFRPSTPVKSLNYLDIEATLGSRIFGIAPEGVERKFFHSTAKNVWIWYENGTTIRYEVRPSGIFKRVNASPFEKLAGTELTNFRAATRHYLVAIKSHYANR